MTPNMLRSAMSVILPSKSLTCDRRGASAITFGLLSPILVGVSGLGIDVTNWQLAKHDLQTTADVAAIAGAMTLAQGGDNADITATIIRELQRNGFIADGVERDISVAVVDSPELSADGSAKTNIELSVHTTGDLYFSGFFLPSKPQISIASKSGVLEGGKGDICILGLDEWSPDTVEFQGTVDAAVNCAVAANSVDPASITAGGNAYLQTSSLQSYGGFEFGSNTDIVSDVLWPYAARVIDPYGPAGRNLLPPTSSTCDHQGKTMIKKKTTLQPGRYCGELRINNADVTLAPGIYVIDGGDFKITGNSSLTGDGVTIVLTGKSANQVGNMDIAGGTHLELTAPDENDLEAWSLGYHGVLFFQDRIAQTYQGNNVQTNKLLGGSNAVLRGAVYFPSQSLTYSGGATLTSGCLQLIAMQVSFQGNAALTLDQESCALVGAEPIRSVKVSVLG